MEHIWSKYCQNSLQLAASRIISLNDITKDILCKYLPKLEHAKILDVGCGTGIFTFFLDDCFQSCEINGLDYDVSFIDLANHKISKHLRNSYYFCVGNGYDLPFPDDYFDLVISHTYLTSLSAPEKALSEKIRTTKKSGRVVSITAQSFQSQMCSLGNYKRDDQLQYSKYLALKNKCEDAYAKQFLPYSFVNSQTPMFIPQMFGASGLREITIQPIGFAFSLSDSSVPIEQKEEFIHCYFQGEKQKLQQFAELSEFREIMDETEINEYIGLMDRHRVFLLDSLGENTVWEWISGLNIMMMGTKARY